VTVSETETTRVVTTGDDQHSVYHTDRDCRCLTDSDTRPATPGEVENKDLNECADCRGASYRSPPSQTCPFCGESTTQLPRHLRHDCDGRP